MKVKMILFFLLFCPIIALGQVWDYPIKPGTEEWRALKNHQEMLNSCQIPFHILQEITTDDLVVLCINYPLKTDLYAYSTIKEGVVQVRSNFNGFKELFQRQDNFTCLLAYLEKENKLLPQKINSEKEGVEKGKLIYDISLVETFLSFDEVLENSNEIQKKELVNVSKSLLDFKTSNMRKFSYYSTTSSALLLGKALQRTYLNMPASQNMREFLKGNIIFESSIIDELNRTYKNNIK